MSIKHSLDCQRWGYLQCTCDAAAIALSVRLALYEQAIKEAEAILGGEYAMHHGPFFDLVQQARATE
jgi:hypothetical protein